MGARIRVPDLESAQWRTDRRDPGGAFGAARRHDRRRDLTAALIDEIPVLAVLGAATENGLTVKDAAELRIKETDRIRDGRRQPAAHGRGGGGAARRT